jgi:hypothetical protein
MKETMKSYGSALVHLLFLGLLLSGGCQKPREVREGAAIQNLHKENSFAAEFRRVYPEAVGYFTHYEDNYGPMTWHARVGIRGRFLLEMKLEVETSPDRLHFPDFRPPQFTLIEAESATKSAGGNLRVKYKTDSQIDFGVREWRALVEKNGDLSVLGIGAGTEPPIPDFDAVWKEF